MKQSEIIDREFALFAEKMLSDMKKVHRQELIALIIGSIVATSLVGLVAIFLM